MNIKLTRREYQMLQYACLSNADIANLLNIKVNTVEVYMQNVKKILGAKNKQEMIVQAIKYNIMSVHNFVLND